jgi:hypothetical protein
LPRWPSDDRRSRIVFITRDVPRCIHRNLQRDRHTSRVDQRTSLPAPRGQNRRITQL